MPQLALMPLVFEPLGDKNDCTPKQHSMTICFGVQLFCCFVRRVDGEEVPLGYSPASSLYMRSNASRSFSVLDIMARRAFSLRSLFELGIQRRM